MISEYGSSSVSPAQAALGDIIVSDPSANALFVQSNCASPPCAAPTILFSGTPYVTPEGVAMDSSGNIIVADGSGKIFRQSPSGGSPALLYSGSPYMSPAGVAIDSSGNIIVADLGAKTIFRQSNCASPPCAAPTPISSTGYHYPFGVVIDPLGNIIVADGSGTVFRQNPAGGTPTPVSFVGYVTPEGVTIDSSGNFIVVDQGGTVSPPAILRQNPSGGAPSTLFSGTPYVSPEFDVVLKPLKATGGCEMAITKTITPNQVQSGGTATVTLTLTPTSSADCNGNDPVYISLIDSMPTSFGILQFVAYQPVSVTGAYGMNCDVTQFQIPNDGGIVSCGIYTPTLIPYPTQSETVTFNVQVTAPAGNTIPNCAIAYVQSSTGTVGNVGCATLTVVGGGSACDLAIAKTMNVSSNGMTVTINLNISNQGPGACTLDIPLALTVNDTMPTGLTATSAGGAGWTCNLVVICHPSSGGSSPPGWSSTVTITAKVTGAAGKIENCAHLIFDPDTNQSNNVSCASATVAPPSGCDLKITKTVSPSSGGSSNSHALVTLTIVNVGQAKCGASTTYSTIVTDNFPEGMTRYVGTVSNPGNVDCGVASSGWNCGISGNGNWYCQVSNSGSTVICNPTNPTDSFSAIPLNMPFTITIPVIVTGTPGSTLNNCATVSDPNDINPANDQSCAMFTVLGGTSTTSTSTSTTPTGPSCIIATAAYGSEMAAPVQFLRSFRDSEVQKTRLGSAFLQAFNGWYYSWAPSIAQQIAPNENYKAATRAIIAPLIGSLFVGNAAFSILAPVSPELAVVSAGLLASALIGLAYLTPICAISWKLSKRRITKRTIYRLAIAAAALTLIATLTTGTSDMAANLTALTVVETLLLAPALVLRKITSYFIQET